MKKRDRQRRRRHQQARSPATATAPGPDAAPSGRSWEFWGWLVAGTAMAALAVTLIVRYWPDGVEPEPIAAAPKDAPARDRKPDPELKPASPSGDPGSLLDEFNKDAADDKDGDTPALANAALEQRFLDLVAIHDQADALKKQPLVSGAKLSDREVKKTQAELQELMKNFDRQADALQKDLPRACKARPQDGVPRWLSGELLMLVGGEPEEILPHLEFAAQHGVKRPRLLGSLALVKLEANRYADAYKATEEALERSGQDRYIWKAYGRIAFSSNRFDEVRERLGRAFPDGLPEWGKAIRRKAVELHDAWEAEEKLRRAEAKANDLPRVRLDIEHRRFARDAAGNALTRVESTGRETVVLELFENQAPLTVANFIELVESRFYDGTSFHFAMPTIMAVGGDPNTRNSDPADDGTGGPGYVIPDEFQLRTARKHFRGSVSMVNTGPRTTGSQFFICLSPQPEADGRHTVFGRVIDGQEAVDRITRGRTTPKAGPQGRPIPGDVLVRAEVQRKRPHEYRALKQ